MNFCKDCKHVVIPNHVNPFGWEATNENEAYCTNPHLKKEGRLHPVTGESMFVERQFCVKLNKNCGCVFFEQKEKGENNENHSCKSR